MILACFIKLLRQGRNNCHTILFLVKQGKVWYDFLYKGMIFVIPVKRNNQKGIIDNEYDF